jgi:hypothetical protein
MRVTEESMPGRSCPRRSRHAGTQADVWASSSILWWSSATRASPNEPASAAGPRPAHSQLNASTAAERKPRGRVGGRARRRPASCKRELGGARKTIRSSQPRRDASADSTRAGRPGRPVLACADTCRSPVTLEPPPVKPWMAIVGPLHKPHDVRQLSGVSNPASEA